MPQKKTKEEKGNLSIHTENIFPIIKRWLYSEHDIFLRELISNAVDAINKRKYADPEFKAEEMKIEVKLDDKKKTIEVSDTGIGMSAEQVGRIFEKFYTVRNPHKRGEGTGLGLAISKMIVHELGGMIEVTSREGEGSRFTVRLPWSARAAPPTGPGDGELRCDSAAAQAIG